MGHPEVENGTPFAFEPVFVADEEGRPLLVPVVKGTWAVSERGLSLAADQLPPLLAGEPHGEDLATSSWRYEPEGSLPKPATDVALLGSAVAPKAGTTQMLVAFQLGTLKKGVAVVGDRGFFKAVGGVGMTRPAPFERIPLQWERAFGGWDRSNPDEKKHECEPRNPVGTGFRSSHGRFEEGLRCPNLEDPARPFKGWGDRPPPAGFGFTSPSWEPRPRLAGTYDKRWEEERAPLLPRDFDRRFLNSAAPGLVAPGFLRGDEAVVASGVVPTGGVAFRLPGVAPPTLVVEHAGREDAQVATRLDTVILDTDAGKLFLLWKGEVPVREPTAVRSIRIVPGAGTPPLPAAAA
ncbi:MAG TPA: DUF2169 domain-containing protein [Anaeromyxobacteraceae bacterium]|jgi:hypothetical protein